MALKTSNKYFIPIISVLLAMLTAMSPLAIDTYLSAMPTIAKDFGVGIYKVEITLTLYFLGFALGNFFGGPLSDSFGRKKIALTGIIIYAITAFVIPFSTKIEHMWIMRTIQAFGGGFASVTVMVFVRDWFEGKQVAKLATIISMIMMLAPLFAPVIGATFLHINGWRTIFYFLVIYATIMFLIFLLVVPESRNKELITKKVNTQEFFGKYKIFFSSKKAVLMLFSISFSMAGMFTFISGASFVYMEYYGFNEIKFPLLFGSNVIFNVFLSLANTLLLKRNEPRNLFKTGLYIQFLAGAILLSTILLSNEPSFWMVFFSIALFVGSLGMIFGNGVAIILNQMPQISGSANATIGVTRFVISFIAGTLPALFHTGNLVPIGLVMFATTLLANLFYFFFQKDSAVF